MQVLICVDGEEIPFEEAPEEIQQALRRHCYEVLQEIMDEGIRMLMDGA
jgi:hypothetical protein